MTTKATEAEVVETPSVAPKKARPKAEEKSEEKDFIQPSGGFCNFCNHKFVTDLEGNPSCPANHPSCNRNQRRTL